MAWEILAEDAAVDRAASLIATCVQDGAVGVGGVPEFRRGGRLVVSRDAGLSATDHKESGCAQGAIAHPAAQSAHVEDGHPSWGGFSSRGIRAGLGDEGPSADRSDR